MISITRAALTAASALFLISSGPVLAKDAPKIGVSFQEMNNPYFIVMNEEVTNFAKLLNPNTQVYVTDARHDVSKQLSDIEDMVSKGINILVINPTDSEGVRAAVDEAKAKGVTVVSVDAQAAGVDAFVGSKNYDAGVLACNALVKEIGGKGEVAILDGIAVVPILERVRGCKDALAKAPDVKLVDVQNGRQERDISVGVAENMMQSHPNLKGIFSVNDGGAMGVLAAIEGSSKKVVLTSVDGAPDAVKAIAAGTAFKATAAQFPRDQMRIALSLALAKYMGARVPAVVPIDVELIDANKAATFAW
jgi:ribose transport system substrate-binding protein